MNIKLITKALHTFSLMTPEDLELAINLHRTTEDERNLLLLALEPQRPASKSTKPPTKERKIEKCAACNYTRRAAVHKDTSNEYYHEFDSAASVPKPSKSKRATGLSDEARQRLSRKVLGVDSGSDITPCGAVLVSSGLTCNLPQGHRLHEDKGYVDYHPFQPSTTAPPATRLSPRSVVPSTSESEGVQGVSLSTQNSETERETVSSAGAGD